jgi:uncharacterized membrane protein
MFLVKFAVCAVYLFWIAVVISVATSEGSLAQLDRPAGVFAWMVMFLLWTIGPALLFVLLGWLWRRLAASARSPGELLLTEVVPPDKGRGGR